MARLKLTCALNEICWKSQPPHVPAYLQGAETRSAAGVISSNRSA